MSSAPGSSYERLGRTAAPPVLEARGDPPPQEALDAAAAALGAGQVVGIPTDTVYGLSVDPRHAGASARLFSVKQRPRGVELPVLVAGADQARELVADISGAAEALMARFWPGALTLVLGRGADLRLDLGDNDRTIGVRCPDHPVARALCRQVGPLATTSANRHREPPANDASGVARLAGVAVVLDAGRCAGVPSTVVDCTAGDPRLLREGSLTWGLIRSHLGA